MGGTHFFSFSLMTVAFSTPYFITSFHNLGCAPDLGHS